MSDTLLPNHNSAAKRPLRSERLLIERLQDSAIAPERSGQVFDDRFAAARGVFERWADLDSSGTLERMSETQLQADFVRDFFGDALQYVRFAEGRREWNLQQGWAIPDAGGVPDGILGNFRTASEHQPQAIIELKGPTVNLDRDRFGNRTPVDQLWTYLNNLPKCRWGILSNIVSLRLYERNHTRMRFEHFTLQGLRDERNARRFYYLLERGGLLDTPRINRTARAAALLEESDNKQQEVGDKLYELYRRNRTKLIHYLHHTLGHGIDDAIAMAQRLIDRIIFIAFCEDRALLPPLMLRKAHDEYSRLLDVVNPRWQNFKGLFRWIDRGHPEIGLETGYNGGLFAKSPVDDLDLPDEPWTQFFRNVGEFDFRDEVNLDVLGHLFERSITELERLRRGEIFVLNGQAEEESGPTMPQSAQRKRMGIYYTPPAFTSRIVDLTVDRVIAERFAAAALRHGAPKADATAGNFPDSLEFWRECLEILRRLKVCDPACGSGAFLFQAYNCLAQRYDEVIKSLERLGDPQAARLDAQIPETILGENLYGVDLSAEAIEITQLALWIRTATRDRKLSSLAHHIVHGNSLVHDAAVHPAGFDWRQRFPEVFERPEGGFDCIIGNPPWERMKLQEREFFAASAPEIATATDAAKRRRLIARLERDNPELFAAYQEALAAAQTALDYARQSGEYPLTGKGDINTYAVFAELASRLVSPKGRVGLLVPSGIASDNTTKDFFASLVDAKRLAWLYDFENREGLFPDVHRSFKFSILGFTGESLPATEADFVFFAHQIEDVADARRHIALTADDIALLNPNTRTCPIFRSRRDAEITKAIYRRVPVLIDQSRREGGNPWGVRFMRMFDQTNDAEMFVDAKSLKAKRYRLEGNRWVKGGKTYLPLYEAKMVQMFDHRAAGVVIDEGNWVRQGQTDATSLVEHQNPEFAVMPRFWVEESDVSKSLEGETPGWFIGFKDITSPTNQRTMIAAMLPSSGVVNSAPIVLAQASVRLQCCLLANLNSFVYDYVARQKVSNVHLNFFIVEQLPTLPPEQYEEKCPWAKRTKLADWISERVLKLTCTAEDMLPLAKAAEFNGGDLKAYKGRLNKWKMEERAQLMAELDAAYFILYGLSKDDAEYVLSTFSGTDAPTGSLPGMDRMSAAQRVLGEYDRLAGR